MSPDGTAKAAPEKETEVLIRIPHSPASLDLGHDKFYLKIEGETAVLRPQSPDSMSFEQAMGAARRFKQDNPSVIVDLNWNGQTHMAGLDASHVTKVKEDHRQIISI